MDNEQQADLSHNFIMNTSNDETKQEEKQNSSWAKIRRTFLTKQISSDMTAKPSWQIARDISINILSKQATKLSLKQSNIPNLTRQRSLTRKQSLYGTSKFSQSNRTPRMPSENDANQITIAHRLLCSFCEGPCIGDYLRCRVCIKTYHTLCLFERGYVSDPLFNLPRMAKQNWSCPECEDLTRLLNQDEIHHLIHAFEEIDLNKDGYIILEEYLSLKPNTKKSDGLELFIQYNYDLGKRYFNLMDATQQGVVAWSDFVRFYGCKLIAAKDKMELTAKLTEKELVEGRNIFFKDSKKTFDNHGNIIITRDYFKQVYDDLIQLLKKKYGSGFVDAILGDEQQTEDRTQKFSIMNWDEFIRELSLLMLLNRSNGDITQYKGRQATIPIHLSNISINSKFPPIKINSSFNYPITRSNTPATIILPNISCDVPFRKHAKLLEKLNQQEKQYRSTLNFSIMENINEDKDIKLPKLKPDARDDRKTIIDPWTSVKEIQQLRNERILINRIHY